MRLDDSVKEGSYLKKVSSASNFGPSDYEKSKPRGKKYSELKTVGSKGRTKGSSKQPTEPSPLLGKLSSDLKNQHIDEESSQEDDGSDHPIRKKKTKRRKKPRKLSVDSARPWDVVYHPKKVDSDYLNPHHSKHKSSLSKQKS